MNIFIPKHISKSETLNFMLEEEKAACELRHELRFDEPEYAELKNFELILAAAWYALLDMNKVEFFKHPITAYVCTNWRKEYLMS